MKRNLLSFVAVMALFASCKKDDKDGSGTGSGATFKTLSDTKWRLSGYVYNYSGTEVDGFSMLPSCTVDNIITFKSDQTNQLDEGPAKCNSADPQVRTEGTWELRGGDKEIYIKGFTAAFGISEMVLTIVSLNESTLKVQYTTSVGGPTVLNTTTYTRVD